MHRGGARYRSFCEGDDDLAFVSALREATNTGLPLIGEALRTRLASEGRRVEPGNPGPRTETRRRNCGASAELQFDLQE